MSSITCSCSFVWPFSQLSISWPLFQRTSRFAKSLNELPTEVLLDILRYLEARDCAWFAATSKRNNAIAKEVLYRNCSDIIFPRVIDPDNVEQPRKLQAFAKNAQYVRSLEMKILSRQTHYTLLQDVIHFVRRMDKLRSISLSDIRGVSPLALDEVLELLAHILVSQSQLRDLNMYYECRQCVYGAIDPKVILKDANVAQLEKLSLKIVFHFPLQDFPVTVDAARKLFKVLNRATKRLKHLSLEWVKFQYPYNSEYSIEDIEDYDCLSTPMLETVHIAAAFPYGRNVPPISFDFHKIKKISLQYTEDVMKKTTHTAKIRYSRYNSIEEDIQILDENGNSHKNPEILTDFAVQVMIALPNIEQIDLVWDNWIHDRTWRAYLSNNGLKMILADFNINPGNPSVKAFQFIRSGFESGSEVSQCVE